MTTPSELAEKGAAARAFVQGAQWWEYHLTGATMWNSDIALAEKEAERRGYVFDDSFTRYLKLRLENIIALLPDLWNTAATWAISPDDTDMLEALDVWLFDNLGARLRLSDEFPDDRSEGA